MKAQEVMGSVDENGLLYLDQPLNVEKHSRVKVIVLFVEEEINSDDEAKESVLEGFRTAWKEAKTGKIKPVSELWDGIDVE